MTFAQRKANVVFTLALFVAGCSDGAGTASTTDSQDAGFDSPPDTAWEVASDAAEEGGDDSGTREVFLDFDGTRMWNDVAELASSTYEGRMPGTPGGELALTYVQQHFQSLNLIPLGTNGFRSPFSFELWLQKGPSRFELEGEAWIEREEFGLLMGSGAAQLESQVVFAGYGMTVPPFLAEDHPGCPLSPDGYDDYAGIDVKDKVVLVLRHGPAGHLGVQAGCPANEAAKSKEEVLWTFGYKAANAALHGASGILIVNRFGTSDPSPIQGGVGAEYQHPSFVVASAHREKLALALPSLASWQSDIDKNLAPNSIDTGLPVVLEADTDVETRTTDNLLAAVAGTDPDLAHEAILFGAHIDHLGIDPVTDEIYFGADDNASGIAVLMELARALQVGWIEPKRTVILAAFNAEELGLIGSCEYVRRPSVLVSNTKAMFSIDMVGVGDGEGVILFGANGERFSFVGDVMRASAAARGVDGKVIQGPPFDASDHLCFALAGVPSVLVSSTGLHDTYHTPMDTADGVLPEVLEMSARLVWGALSAFALGQEEELVSGAEQRSLSPTPAVLPEKLLRAKLATHPAAEGRRSPLEKIRY